MLHRLFMLTCEVRIDDVITCFTQAVVVSGMVYHGSTYTARTLWVSLALLKTMALGLVSDLHFLKQPKKLTGNTFVTLSALLAAGGASRRGI